MVNGIDLFKSTSEDNDLLKKLSINSEFNNKRKETGSYYTPNDLANYIVANSFIHYYYPELHNMYSFNYCLSYFVSKKKKCRDLLYKCTVFDPTCGAGDLLLSVLQFKFSLAYYINEELNNRNIYSIIRTIYGNDFNKTAIDSFIKRVCIYIKRITDNDVQKNITNILKKNTTSIDYIKGVYLNSKKFDIIVGNPPYVEDNVYDGIIDEKYGNVYCNVIRNCFNNSNNIISLIVPISYISTPRMLKIRNIVIQNNCSQIVSSYSDRPDCLFNDVHQKLNVLVIKLNTDYSIYTTQYKYWYKDERFALFNNNKTFKNRLLNDLFIPKIGNRIDCSIYKKVYKNNNSFYNLQNFENFDYPIYLNMRAAFWIKCFKSSSKSNEYNTYYFDKTKQNFIYCVLNSSLFFWYWVTISDCWHITNKELSGFDFSVCNYDSKVFDTLSKKLEFKLNKTKKYIGSKQVDYEYKHKLCKDIIDKIDIELAKVYGLTETELNYIINFAISYRVSN